MSEPQADVPEAERKPLTAEALAHVQDCEVVAEWVPEWRAVVHLRVLSAADGLALGEQVEALPKNETARAAFLTLGACLCNPDGSPLFESLEAAEKVLRQRSSRVLLRLQERAMELQGWRTGDEGGEGKDPSRSEEGGASRTD